MRAPKRRSRSRNLDTRLSHWLARPLLDHLFSQVIVDIDEVWQLSSSETWRTLSPKLAWYFWSQLRGPVGEECDSVRFQGAPDVLMAKQRAVLDMLCRGLGATPD